MLLAKLIHPNRNSKNVYHHHKQSPTPIDLSHGRSQGRAKGAMKFSKTLLQFLETYASIHVGPARIFVFSHYGSPRHIFWFRPFFLKCSSALDQGLAKMLKLAITREHIILSIGLFTARWHKRRYRDNKLPIEILQVPTNSLANHTLSCSRADNTQ